MNRGAVVVILLVLLGVGGLVGYDQYQKLSQSPAAAPVDPGAQGVPPAGAIVLDEDVTPEMVVTSLRRTPGGPASSDAVGAWIREKGWDGTVTEITDAQGGGVALRMQMFSTAVQGQEFWTILVLPSNDKGVKVGDAIRFRGRIDAVESIPAGMAPVFRIVVRDGGIL